MSQAKRNLNEEKYQCKLFLQKLFRPVIMSYCTYCSIPYDTTPKVRHKEAVYNKKVGNKLTSFKIALYKFNKTCNK